MFWLDEAEPEFSVYDYDNYRYFMGPATKIGNIYPQLYARTFYEGQRKAGMETAVNLTARMGRQPERQVLLSGRGAFTVTGRLSGNSLRRS